MTIHDTNNACVVPGTGANPGSETGRETSRETGSDAAATQRTETRPALQLHDRMSPGRRFRVHRPFSGISRNGNRFMTCEFEADGMRLRTYAWERDCDGFHLPRHGERIYAAGRIRWRSGRYELVCREFKVEDTAARIRWARERTREMVRTLEPGLLAEFLRRVFADPKIGPAFLVAPASLNHHHAFSGALLVHSAEAAWSVFRWCEGQRQQGLATTAALLHDIGKVRTLAGNMTRTRLGALVGHEDLTLEVLAPHLCWLDTAWPEGALTLRHLLTSRPCIQAPSPAYTALELVRVADRISACRAPADSGIGAIRTPA